MESLKNELLKNELRNQIKALINQNELDCITNIIRIRAIIKYYLKIIIYSRNRILDAPDEVKVLRKLAVYYLKKSAINFTDPNAYKKLYITAFKNFYLGYGVLIYSFVVWPYLIVSNKLKTYLYKKNLFKKLSNIYFKQIYPKLNLLDIYCSKLLTRINSLKNALLEVLVLLKLNLGIHYTKTLEPYVYHLFDVFSEFDKEIYKIDIKLLKVFYEKQNILQKQIAHFKENKKIKAIKKMLALIFLQVKKINGNIKEFFFYILSLDKKQLVSYLQRFTLIFGIYFIPFMTLATQAFVPIIDEEVAIVNPFTSIIFTKIPFLINLIEIFRPLITNQLVLFWLILGYFLIFPINYRALKIPYKIAYNGTIASVFLNTNYVLIIMPSVLTVVFDSVRMISDLYFLSFLKYLISDHKFKELRFVSLRLFRRLVKMRDSQIKNNYNELIFLLIHTIFSPLSLICLAALVYNCVYYIIHNKNPEIRLVTKTVNATIKNPEEQD